MKRILYISILGLLFTAFTSCEKNNPLANQGELTGVEIANVILSQIPATAAGDTITLSTNTWAKDDNIKSLEYSHRGFKTYSLTIKMDIDTSDVEGVKPASISKTITTDTLFIDETSIATITELLPYYQTLMNAYVVKYDFVIPSNYLVQMVDDKSVINEMETKYFDQFRNELAKLMDKRMAETIFTIDAQAADTLFTKVENVFTGTLTTAGFTFVEDNLTKDDVKNYLKGAIKEEFAELTIRSKVTLTPNFVSEDEKTFEIKKSE